MALIVVNIGVDSVVLELQVEKSLLVTGFGYEHDEAWSTNLALFKEFTGMSRVWLCPCTPWVNSVLWANNAACCQGVRRLGAASVDMCHVALGIVDAYWEYRLKPWDMAAGVLVIRHQLLMFQL